MRKRRTVLAVCVVLLCACIASASADVPESTVTTTKPAKEVVFHIDTGSFEVVDVR